MQPDNAREIAISSMKKGKNCCQSVISSALSEFGLEVPNNLMSATCMMGHGMDCGATCGAFSGMQIASGVLFHQLPRGERRKMSRRLHELFTERYGTTSCSEIRQRQKAAEGDGIDNCIELTGKSAAMLIEEWNNWQAESEGQG